MSRTTSIFLTLLFSLSAWLAAGPPGSEWMTGLEGNQSLGGLSIPGAHNAAARFEPIAGTAKCQHLTIPALLGAGVRFLDVRCRNVRGKLWIYHGPVDQKKAFEEIVAECLDFLNLRPGETILLSVKEEGSARRSDRAFEDIFDEEIGKHKERWWLESGLPSLAGARGKLVLVRRFPVLRLPKGIDATGWRDFRRAVGRETVLVQDDFEVKDVEMKWHAFIAAFRETNKEGRKNLFLNYASGYRPGLLDIPDIPAVSNRMRERLKQHLGEHPHGRYGVVMLDFADAEMTERIWRTNVGR